MRLIDADALREVVISFQYTPTSNENERCVRAIDAAPTVEKQEPVGVEKGIGYLYCGGCKTALAPLDWPKPWKFCPWCGRRVRWE